MDIAIFIGAFAALVLMIFLIIFLMKIKFKEVEESMIQNTKILLRKLDQFEAREEKRIKTEEQKNE